MSWTYIASTVESATNGNSLSWTHLQSISANDLIVMFAHFNGASATLTATQGTGAAWTAQRDNISVGSESATYSLFWKAANGSEPSSFDVSSSGTSRFTALYYIFRPSTGNFSYDTLTTTSRSGSPSTSYVISGITTGTDAIALAFGCTDNLGDPAASVNNSYTNLEHNPGAQQITLGATRAFASGGATGDVTFSTDESDYYYGEHVSFVTAAAAGGATHDRPLIQTSQFRTILTR